MAAKVRASHLQICFPFFSTISGCDFIDVFVANFEQFIYTGNGSISVTRVRVRVAQLIRN